MGGAKLELPGLHVLCEWCWEQAATRCRKGELHGELVCQRCWQEPCPAAAPLPGRGPYWFAWWSSKADYQQKCFSNKRRRAIYDRTCEPEHSMNTRALREELETGQWTPWASQLLENFLISTRAQLRRGHEQLAAWRIECLLSDQQPWLAKGESSMAQREADMRSRAESEAAQQGYLPMSGVEAAVLRLELLAALSPAPSSGRSHRQSFAGIMEDLLLSTQARYEAAVTVDEAAVLARYEAAVAAKEAAVLARELAQAAAASKAASPPEPPEQPKQDGSPTAPGTQSPQAARARRCFGEGDVSPGSGADGLPAEEEDQPMRRDLREAFDNAGGSEEGQAQPAAPGTPGLHPTLPGYPEELAVAGQRTVEEERADKEQQAAGRDHADEEEGAASQKWAVTQLWAAEQECAVAAQQAAPKEQAAAEERAAQDEWAAEAQQATEEERAAEAQRADKEERAAEEQRVAKEERAASLKRVAEAQCAARADVARRAATHKQAAEEERASAALLAATTAHAAEGQRAVEMQQAAEAQRAAMEQRAGEAQRTAEEEERAAGMHLALKQHPAQQLAGPRALASANLPAMLACAAQQEEPPAAARRQTPAADLAASSCMHQSLIFQQQPMAQPQQQTQQRQRYQGRRKLWMAQLPVPVGVSLAAAPTKAPAAPPMGAAPPVAYPPVAHPVSVTAATLPTGQQPATAAAGLGSSSAAKPLVAPHPDQPKRSATRVQVTPAAVTRLLQPTPALLAALLAVLLYVLLHTCRAYSLAACVS